MGLSRNLCGSGNRRWTIAVVSLAVASVSCVPTGTTPTPTSTTTTSTTTTSTTSTSTTSTTTTTTIPVPAGALTGASSVTAGGDHTCVLTTAGTVQCFGANYFGQLGRSTNTFNQSPNPAPATVTGLNSVTALTAGNVHTCALKSDGTVSCFGSNSSGQLGRTTAIPNNPFPTPVAVPGMTGITAVEAGAGFTCLLKDDGTVYCFGSNITGQLGVAAFSSRSTPAVVPGVSGVTQLAAGDDHVCALKTDGTVVCWGSNIRGALGTTTNVGVLVGGFIPVPPANPPAAVPGLTDVVSLTAGRYHTCAVKSDGALVCFGSNEFGELGIPFVANANPTPTEVSTLTNVTGVSSAYDHTCALADGGLSCWGRNWHGQVGTTLTNGTDAGISAPTVVAGLDNPSTALATGARHTCIVNANTTVSCFGENRNGELGSSVNNGGDTPNPAPALVQA